MYYPENQAFIGEQAPRFEAPAVLDGEITRVSLDQYLEQGKWVVLFFYPKDFTFVCPTEIIAFSDRAAEFAELNCQVIGASTDTEECHLAWIRTPRKKGGLGKMQIPLVADTTKSISARYGTLLKGRGIALRGLYIINPQGVIEQITINGLDVGRDVDETLRLLAAYQFVTEHGEVCPAGWTPGEDTMVPTTDGSVSYFESGAMGSDEDDFAAKLKPVASKADYDALVASGNPVVVDFMADWCGKCRQIAPHVDNLIDEYPGITFAKVDTEKAGLKELTAELGVTALPHFKLIKGGMEVVPPVVGYKKKPLTDAVAALSSA